MIHDPGHSKVSVSLGVGGKDDGELYFSQKCDEEGESQLFYQYLLS